jgi:predicted amidophosphoribosyltransferase
MDNAEQFQRQWLKDNPICKQCGQQMAYDLCYWNEEDLDLPVSCDANWVYDMSGYYCPRCEPSDPNLM